MVKSDEDKVRESIWSAMASKIFRGEGFLPCGCTIVAFDGTEQPSITAVEYSWETPERYDGTSEFRCNKCDRRWGRWSGKELGDGQYEKPYGRD